MVGGEQNRLHLQRKLLIQLSSRLINYLDKFVFVKGFKYLHFKLLRWEQYGSVFLRMNEWKRKVELPGTSI